jgi:NADH-quinone oxidoreductase subunit M
MLGIFALSRLGAEGGALQMINHGLSTGGLFACVGMLYERYHTREIADMGGLARRVPILTFFFIVFTMASIGLPGLNGFVGEFLVLIGTFQRAFVETNGAWAGQLRFVAVVAVLGVVLGAWYMLWLVQRTFFGPLKEPHAHAGAPPVRDLSLREVAALAPLLVFIVWIGLQPQRFLTPMRQTLAAVAAPATEAYDDVQRTAAAETSPRREPRIVGPIGNPYPSYVDQGSAALGGARP